MVIHIYIMSYLGMKSWDLQKCDRVSTITHVLNEKKNSAYYNNRIFYFFLGWLIVLQSEVVDTLPDS